MNGADERMQRYLAGELTPEERVAFEDEVLADADLANRLYADVNLRAAIEAAARARRERSVTAVAVKPWWRRRVWRWVAPAMGVATVAIFMMVTQTEPERTPVFRSTKPGFAPVEPAGNVTGVPSQFVWRASDEAAFYRFVLFDTSATTVFETVTSDTSVIIDAATISVPAEGYWVVTPLNDLRFRIAEAILSRYSTRE
jgi:hypothetical protein